MSHSKIRKNGKSLYVSNWNPEAKKYIHTCYLCGRSGYSPALEELDFQSDPQRRAIYRELTRLYPGPLSLDAVGRCAECARWQDRPAE